MIETYYRRALIIVWALFLGWIVDSDVAGQNLFDGYANRSTNYDPPSDLLSFVSERSDGALPENIRTAMTQAVVVKNQLGNGWAKGSGTYLGDGLYMSAWHVVRDNPGGKIVVEWKNGKSVNAKVAGKEPLYDMVLLETTEKPFGGVPLSLTNATPGSSLFLGGYSQGPLQAWRGRATRLAAPVGAPAADWTFATGAAISGDSGGPVIDEKGCFVGPLWGSGGGETCFTNTGRVQRFLFPWNARLAAWQRQGNGCYGGGYCPPQQFAPQQPPSNSGGGRVDVDDQPQTQPTQPGGGNLGWPSGPRPQQPPAQPGCECDPEAIADAIRKSLGDLEGEQGPAGEIGLTGPMGPAGPAGKDGQVTPEQIAVIVNEITKNLISNPALKGEKGEPGERGPEGPRGPGISDISMDDNGYVYVEYGVNGRREQIGRLQLPEQSVAGQRSPAYFEIVPKQ